MRTEKEFKQALEQLIDEHSVASMVYVMAEICREKAAHCAENWQSFELEKAWNKYAQKLDNCNSAINKLPVKF